MGIFSNVSAVKPPKTVFSPHHSNCVSMTFGELVPMFAVEMVPGDIFTLNTAIVGRLTSALKSPMLGQFDMVVEAFFCPNRLLMGSDANFEVPVGERNFEDILTGGKDGNEDLELPLLGAPRNQYTISFDEGGIMDSLGEQIDSSSSTSASVVALTYSGLNTPHALVHRAYRWIWNEFYRSEFLQDPVQVCQYIGDGSVSDDSFIEGNVYDQVLNRGWRRDYFTSALPFQQFGDAPALPLSGFGNVVFNIPQDSASGKGLVTYVPSGTTTVNLPATVLKGASGNTVDFSLSGAIGSPVRLGYVNSNGVLFTDVNEPLTSYNTIDMSNVATFDISDLRTAFQVQKWKERNARVGVRYTEYLQAHFATTPGDYRLQRPYPIGALRSPWYVSEVLQTSASVEGSGQGNQAGQAISLSRGCVGKFRAHEFGYLLVLVSVLPKAQYQQGLSRHFSRRTRYDFYSPEFAHLSEQAILNKEIFVSGDPTTDNKEFGFTPVWNELRYLPSRVGRHMRTNAKDYTFDYWHIARYFQETPVLNSEFLSVNGTPEADNEFMRIFDVQDEDPFVIEVGLNLKATRPLPYEGTPGLVDHF